MLFFSTAIKEHKLEFKKLADYDKTQKKEYIKLTACWAKKAWGYLHLTDKEFYKKDIKKKKEQIYVASFAGQPVAMFGLFEKNFEPLREALEVGEKEAGTVFDAELKFVYFDYIYVDERFRGLGFAHQLLTEAKSLAYDLEADVIYLETLNPKLNNLYIKKLEAKVLCESLYVDSPTDVLRVSM